MGIRRPLPSALFSRLYSIPCLHTFRWSWGPSNSNLFPKRFRDVWQYLRVRNHIRVSLTRAAYWMNLERPRNHSMNFYVSNVRSNEATSIVLCLYSKYRVVCSWMISTVNHNFEHCLHPTNQRITWGRWFFRIIQYCILYIIFKLYWYSQLLYINS